jgi:GAF domain-containing protein
MSTESSERSQGLSADELQRLALLPAEAPVERIDQAIAMAREALGMELGYLTEFAGDELIYRAASGDGTSFDVSVGEGRPLSGSYCERMIANRIPHLVADTSQIEELRDAAMTRVGRVAAYAGVSVRLSDGTLYGTLCTVSHSPRPDLGDDRIQLLEMLSKIVASGIQQERLERENDRLRNQLIGMSDELDAAEEDRRLSRILLSGEFPTLE